jgi:hypothetical protein
MKLRYLSLILFQTCVLSIFAMSPDEKTEFKRQLKAAPTSDAMQQIITNKLVSGESVRLSITAAHQRPVRFVGTVGTGNADLLQAVLNATGETFYEEMHPIIFDNADYLTEVVKFQRYSWANKNVVAELQKAFAIHQNPRVNHCNITPELTYRLHYIKNQVAALTGENRLLGGKNDFSRRVSWLLDNNPGLGIKIVKYAGIGVLVAAVTGSIYYWYTSKVDEHADDEDTQADQENARHDEIQ